MVFNELVRLFAKRAKGTLTSDLGAWERASRTEARYRPHLSQVQSVSGSLRKLIDAIEARVSAEPAVRRDTRLRTLYSKAGAVWTHFTAMWSQRADDRNQRWLVAADDLAWILLESVISTQPDTRRYVTPLVYLSPDAFPFAQTGSFTVAGAQTHNGKAFCEVLNKLPVPIIGVPWSARGSAADLAFVAHEVGHVLVAHFEAEHALKALLPSDIHPAWRNWAHECLCDAIGAYVFGDGYVATLSGLLADLPNEVQRDAIDTGRKYPPRTVRIALCDAAANGGTPTWVRWGAAYPPSTEIEELVAQSSRVVEYLLGWAPTGVPLRTCLSRACHDDIEAWHRAYKTSYTPSFDKANWQASLLASISAAGSRSGEAPGKWDRGIHDHKALTTHYELRTDVFRDPTIPKDRPSEPVVVDLSDLTFFLK